METRSNHILVGSVVLALVAAVIIAAFWFSRLASGEEKEYDIYFQQSVNGLAKGSGVTFSGVPSGQVKEIQLWKKDPSFVRVRISVKEDVPVLQGTTRSEEHTSELQSLMRISYAVFCLKKKKSNKKH